ncbi:MAG: hypothetical protein ABW168_01470 [Sedimenticola sp.]
MNNNFTIFFTFVADGDIRRKYIEVALRTLFDHENSTSIPVIVIDASSADEAKKNQQLFCDLNNLTYIHDAEVNPFKRCKKYLHLIKTDFVLRLLEDCAYINLSHDNFSFIEKDIALLRNKGVIGVVQYPIINEQEFKVVGSTVYYPAIDFNKKDLNEYNNYKYYHRSQERKIYHYLCNNILYRTEFFIRHWTYFEEKYQDHNSAESGDLDNIVYKFFSKNRYSLMVVRMLVRWWEKIFHSEHIIEDIVVTETMLNSDVVHIGYYSTEINVNRGDFCELDTSQKGVVSVLSHLKVFNDINLLDNIKFKRIKG